MLALAPAPWPWRAPLRSAQVSRGCSAILIAAPRGWGAMRVAQERYVSVMRWIEHGRARRLMGNLLTERTAAIEEVPTEVMRLR